MWWGRSDTSSGDRTARLPRGAVFGKFKGPIPPTKNKMKTPKMKKIKLKTLELQEKQN